jgi:hypothetical protein
MLAGIYSLYSMYIFGVCVCIYIYIYIHVYINTFCYRFVRSWARLLCMCTCVCVRGWFPQLLLGDLIGNENPYFSFTSYTDPYWRMTLSAAVATRHIINKLSLHEVH